MARHSSATPRAESPQATSTTRTNTIINALKRRAQALLHEKSIDAPSRAIIRYALETNDPWLARLVRRVDAGETIVDAAGFLETLEPDHSDANEEKIDALAEMICRAGDESKTKISGPAGAHGDAREFDTSQSAGEQSKALCLCSLR